MVIFTLGLSLVIITNNMFATLNDQFGENVAEIELKDILDELKNQIQRNLLIHPEVSQSISQQFNFPSSLGNSYRYTIDISNSTDGKQIILTGRSLRGNIIQQKTFSSGSIYVISATGEFTSTSSFLSLNLQKNHNKIAILIS